MAKTAKIYLASSSKRRTELLEQIGLRHIVLSFTVDETRLQQESPAELVKRLALLKAMTGLEHEKRVKKIPVLGADTLVLIHDVILGKPKDAAEAEQMLEMLSARSHLVLSAVAVVTPEQQRVAITTSQVTLRRLSSADIKAYLDLDEYQGKAGAYGVQGIAATFISRISGSYSGIMGLPLYETSQLLRHFEIDILHP